MTSEQATVALDKHDCAACGAQAEWHPATQRLVCTFCGTAAPYEADAEGVIAEIDLVTALRDLSDDERGWAVQRRSVRCRSCRAVSIFDPERVGQNCEFCGSPELVDYDEIRAPLRPGSVLPFTQSTEEAREQLRRWCRSRWFAPNRLGKHSLLDQVHGLYVPYWTFDARVRCPWRAQSGTYYYTTESYRDRQGRRRQRKVRHVRWQPASGTLEHFFDDLPVPGTTGLDRDLLAKIEPFPVAELVPYDTAYLSGFVVEHYQVVLIDAQRESRSAMETRLRQLCGAQVPGDTYRNLEIDPDYGEQTFKLILVPVWILSYDLDGTAFQVLMNGRTGRLAGRYPKSPWKIAGLVLALLTILAVIVLLSSL
jgi:hypothetical protein